MTGEYRVRGPNNTARSLFVSSSLLGLQMLWSTEFAQAAPYLLQLGLAKSGTSLVFLAGPLGGLIVHPLVGALSDQCTSSLGRRRPFIIGGGVICVASLLLFGFANELAGIWASDESLAQRRRWTLALAIISIYALDGGINAVQAMDRALIADVVPANQQNQVNVWAGRMHGIGSIAAFFVNSSDASNWFGSLAHTQIQAISIFCILTFTAAHALTCLAVVEPVRSKSLNDRQARQSIVQESLHAIRSIWHTFLHLSRPIWRVLCIQLFGWMALFCLLFYSSTWVAELYLRSHYGGDLSSVPPNVAAEATRAGSRALLGQSIVNFAAAMVVPHLLFANGESGGEDGQQRFRAPWLSLSSAWMIGQGILAVLMLLAWTAKAVWAATLTICMTGIPMTFTLWIPFVLLGELIPHEAAHRQASAAASPTVEERQSFLEPEQSSKSLADLELARQGLHSSGTILGLHNVCVVLPQLAMSLLSSLIFAVMTPGKGDHGNPISLIFFLGGVFALFAAYLCFLLHYDETAWRHRLHSKKLDHGARETTD